MTFVKVNNPISKTFDGIMNELFNDLPVGFGKAMREDVLNYPPVNIIYKNDHYHLQLAAPGLEKTDFNIKLDGKLLTISTEKKEEKTEETDKMIRKEFSYKAFKRSFTVDDKLDAANISAAYENGILKLDLPKKEEVKNSSTEIRVN